MMRFVCHVPLMPRGSHFLLLRQKKVTKKGDPDDWPDPAMLRKKRNGGNSLTLKQSAVLIAFFLRFSGPINGDPSNRYLIASR
jgi:hypothetical protein